MELRVTESTENELSIEIAGEDHTFMNVLKGALLEHDDVSAATYDVNPEQSGGQTEPILTIKTEGGAEPLEALEEGPQPSARKRIRSATRSKPRPEPERRPQSRSPPIGWRSISRWNVPSVLLFYSSRFSRGSCNRSES